MPDGRHSLVVEALDAGYNSGTDQREVLIDNTPPGQREALSVDGGDAWRATNRFRLTWKNPTEEHGPIAAAEYEVCPAQASPSDTKGCERGEPTGDDLEAIEDLKVPGPGAWTLRLWLRDAAGNADSARAGQPLTLRLDQEAPELFFDEQNPADPARVSVIAIDATSGTGGGEIEIRKRGDQAWSPVPTQVTPQGLAGVVDDEHLPDAT